MNSRLTICSVGDLMICDSPLYASVGVGSRYPALRQKLFAGCRQLFAEADITVGNFETVVYKPKNKSLREQQMSCPPAVISDLKEAGFTVLHLANNHCMQHGTAGYEQTKRFCKKYGIETVGSRDQAPCFIEKNGQRAAFLSLCIHLEWYEPDHILYEDRIGKLIGDVRALRQAEPQTLIVTSVHWGDEFADHPSNAVIALAHRLAECGADVILGHHPHVYQGAEQYQGSVILYSQGNFISDMVPQLCRQTAVARIVSEFDGQHRKLSYELLPFYIEDSFVPMPADGGWIAERQALLEKALNGQFTDEQYWARIKANHAKGHGAFKRYFKGHIRDYRLAVSSRMLAEFVGRKVKRIIGTTTDGRVSSMDPAIREALRQTESQ